jgi:hypothetical protein
MVRMPNALLGEIQAVLDVCAAAHPGITYTGNSGFFWGPQDADHLGDFCVAYFCWKWAGDWYDINGIKTKDIPDSAYAQDADEFWYGTVTAFGTNYSHDNNPPPEA